MPIKKAKPIKKSSTKSGKKAKVSAVASRARKLGLTSHGYGRWGKNGRITHRTAGNKLVEVKDSKHNRVMTREGRDKAKTILAKMNQDYTQKMVKFKMALKKAEGRDDKEAVAHLKQLISKAQKEVEKARERTLKLHGRPKKPAGAA
jgi:hypothetical protein